MLLVDFRFINYIKFNFPENSKVLLTFPDVFFFHRISVKVVKGIQCLKYSCALF